eukprot:CAMPEP_0172595584 /NCGR_PEP_ID=MMETSP1068-20121228/15192_1 /TAXON_ID=35684 /ORGANISM="Pseudopedinella elastica, Strain CCMP716" /LENGTH=33 /DNA_ID= /DNA_START= /DNA_END= /DNA_ORIENTATION=
MAKKAARSRKNARIRHVLEGCALALEELGFLLR